VAEIVVPAADGLKVAHYEIRQKAAFDWPLAVSAVALKMSGSTIESARVVMGYVAPVPWVSPEAGASLKGKSVSEDTAKAAAEAALEQAKPLSHNAYKVQLAKVALKRAILKAAGGPHDRTEDNSRVRPLQYQSSASVRIAALEGPVYSGGARSHSAAVE
jgi:xanthine dehydrogenase YagS FAD-binding subunit